MEGINLVKGQRIDITKTNPGLKIAAIGLGWDTKADVDVFLLPLSGGKLESVNLLYFNSPKMSEADFKALFPNVRTAENLPTVVMNGACVHSGDNRSGDGDGDDETMLVLFEKLPESIDEIIVCANIYEAVSRGQNFGMVEGAYCRVFDFETNTEICKLDLTEDFSNFNGIIVAKFYKKDGEWKFQAMSQGVNGTITQIANPYL